MKVYTVCHSICIFWIHYSMVKLQQIFLVSKFFIVYDNFPFTVDGSWGAWSSWTRCSKSCDQGMKERSRQCRKPRHGGKRCRGDSVQRADCLLEPCFSMYQKVLYVLAVANETRSHLDLSHFAHCIMGFIQFRIKMVVKEIKVQRRVIQMIYPMSQMVNNNRPVQSACLYDNKF